MSFPLMWLLISVTLPLPHFGHFSGVSICSTIGFSCFSSVSFGFIFSFSFILSVSFEFNFLMFRHFGQLLQPLKYPYFPFFTCSVPPHFGQNSISSIKSISELQKPPSHVHLSCEQSRNLNCLPFLFMTFRIMVPVLQCGHFNFVGILQNVAFFII